MTILENYKVCLHHEIMDRAWARYELRFHQVDRAIRQLLGNTIDRMIIPSPYGKPFHFYFLSETDADEVKYTINYKLELLQQHAKLTDEVGRLGELLVGKIIEDLGYEEIEIRKEKHGDIGIGRRDIDVWGKHLHDYYQNIEVKNRRQQVNVNDIDDVEAKTVIAQAHWNLPIKSALVCSFIYPKALEKANSVDIPVVITKKVFVPKEYAGFYEEYSQALGSYYIEIADYENPPEYLIELMVNFILDHEYEE